MGYFKSNGDRVRNSSTRWPVRLSMVEWIGANFSRSPASSVLRRQLAYGLIGVAVPTAALAEEGKKGGTLRIGMEVKGAEGPAHL